MLFRSWVIGKTNEPYLAEGIDIYTKRLRHYVPFEMITLPDVKNAGKLSSEQLKAKEAEIVLKKLKPEDFLILLDERGRNFTSEEFAVFLEKKLQLPDKKLVFLVGGAYGFAAALYDQAEAKLSLSKMTFSHQMVRLFFAEQVYRAMTILRNEPYHNG